MKLLCRIFTGLIALTSFAIAQPPKVVTDISPVHSLAARVMDGIGTPDLIVSPGATAHNYTIKPSVAAALEQAQLVFQIGAGLTPWLDQPLKNLAVDANIVELMETAGTTRLDLRKETMFEVPDNDHETTHDESYESNAASSEHHSEHGHHNDIDPHGWLDPRNGQIWLDIMATELARIDPVNATAYYQNASAGKAELEETIVSITTLLEPALNQQFIVFHDAYRYFENRFKLPVLGAISMSDATPPSPARVAAIRAKTASLHIACVFAEPQFQTGLVSTVIEGSGAASAVIDPMGAELELGPNLYPQLLKNMASQVASCWQK